MIDITFKNIEKYYGVTQILKDITFDVQSGDRIGIIGRNGCGKTTLFKIASGIEDYQGGQLFTRKNIKVAYLDQMPKYENDLSVIDVLKMPFEEVFSLQTKLRESEQKMTQLSSNELQNVMAEYADMQQRYELIGGYSVEEEVAKVTTGLRFDYEFLNKKYINLSGGQKTIVEFAKILLEKPDVLLLDEPTNHLDFKAIEWLEIYLKDYNGAILVISHDRYFLDQVVTKIVEIEDGESEIYFGNYTYYMVEKERRYEELMKQYNNQQKKIKSMQQAIYRFKEWGRVSDDQAFFKKAQNMEKRIEKMDKVDKPRVNRRNLMLNLKDQNRSGKEVLMIENMSKSFDDNILFKNLDLSLYYQDAFALVGGNGTGKSTILKAVLNSAFENLYSEYLPDEGKIRIAKNAKIAFLEQEVAFENEEITVLESITRFRNITDGEARFILAGYLFFKDDVFKKLNDLSGGERSRLRLCHLLLDEVNFMILDEPTNHLDIPSREMLEDALINFEGTILFISHDRYFINRLAQEVYELNSNGLKRYIGNYDDYFERKSKEVVSTVSPKPIKKEYKSNNVKKMNSFKMDKLESEIKAIEDDLQQIEVEISNNETNYDELIKLTRQKEVLNDKHEQLMEEWMEIIN
jgi:ATPase subunit of ABC transporter with duplicated ATPase domains